MSGQVYAVKREDEDLEEALPGVIIAVFSNEGLAQTHAASWRQLGEIGVVYTVAQVSIDEAVVQATVFFATMNIDLTELTYDAGELTAAPVIVAADLPPCLVDVDTTYDTVEFTEYGWSAEDAIQRLQSLMDEFIAMRHNRLEEARVKKLAEKQAATAALRARYPIRGLGQDEDWDLLPW